MNVPFCPSEDMTQFYGNVYKQQLEIRDTIRLQMTKARRAKRWTFVRIARLARVSDSTVTKLEANGGLNLATIIPCANVLGLRVKFEIVDAATDDLKGEMDDLRYFDDVSL